MKRNWIKNPETGKPKEEPVLDLVCCLCGRAVKGRQFKEREKGSGLCSRCYHFLKSTCNDKELIKAQYGEVGYHFKIGEYILADLN